MKKLPIGIQSIKKMLSNREYAYVDKTGFAYRLINGGIPHYFMSRPRRFGKSLFINTLEEIFKGNKELFKGLEIDKNDYDWQEYPVLYFDFYQLLTDDSTNLKDSLKRNLAVLAKDHNLSIELPSPQEGLVYLIKALSEQNRVVVLVDEYDKPIIDNLKNIEVAKQNRDLMRNFFRNT